MSGSKGLGLARVAAAAGVSIATVSNTINRPEIVAPHTRERILAIMAELDFVPNRAAATLRQGSNRLLGLVVPEIVNPFYAAITESIAVAAGREGYALALCVSHDDPTVERRHFEMLAEQRAAGAIVVPLGASEERLKQLRMVGTHLVLIDRLEDTHEGCSVVVDDVMGGTMAVEHLLASRGAAGITMVNGPLSIPQCADRLAGARAALQRSGSAENTLVQYVAPHMTIAEGAEIGHAIAASGSPLDIFCANDQLAVGVIRGLHESGIAVPRDARVVGYGDLALATQGETSITSVGQPKASMGEIAVERVLEEITEGPRHTHSTTVFSPELVLRASAPAH